ncbi:MAG: hypothetical protein HPY50_17365 [Firmicutes bacterium]|nr:hypothetical protein [Bacillota bacterium]
MNVLQLVQMQSLPAAAKTYYIPGMRGMIVGSDKDKDMDKPAVSNDKTRIVLTAILLMMVIVNLRFFTICILSPGRGT